LGLWKEARVSMEESSDWMKSESSGRVRTGMAAGGVALERLVFFMELVL
jgi:hypothetical protein